MKLKKIAIAALAAMTMATGAMGITASAAPCTLSANTSGATLTNTSGSSRYGIVNYNIYKRSSDAYVTQAYNEGVLANYGSIRASKSGYSSSTYYYYASGSIYNGTNVQSGSYYSLSASNK